jgi:hypothetical protein
MRPSKQSQIISDDDYIWAEAPMSLTVHTADEEDHPEIIVPDHDAGGWRSHRVLTAKPRLGFLP